MKADSRPESKPVEKSHEKAQRAEKLTGPIHALPKGAALGGSSESDKSPSASSDALAELAAGKWDAELQAWSLAVTSEVIAGKQLDALVRYKAAPEVVAEADEQWHQALELVKVSYERLPTVGDLSLTMRLAQALAPKSARERATVGLGRALAGVTVEAQRLMIATYPPEICAAKANRVLWTWAAWEEAERSYVEACASLDLPLRTQKRTEITHFRRLMREILFLWFQAEETRAIRRAVRRGVPRSILEAFYDETLYSELLRWKGILEVAEIRAASEERARAESFRTTPFAGFVPAPAWIADRAELESEQLLSVGDDDETERTDSLSLYAEVKL